MPGLQKVSFTNPYSAEETEIERRRKLAEALQLQGQTPFGPTEQVGGWAIPRSPWEGIGKAAQSISGAYQNKRSDELENALRERVRGDYSADRAALVAALSGRPATSEQIVDEQAAGGEGAPATINAPAQAPNPQAMQSMEFRSPMFQQMQAQQLAQQLQPPKPAEPFTLAPGAVRYDAQGRQIVAAPKPAEPFTLAPGAARYDAQGKPIVTAPEKPGEFEAMLRAAGIDPASPEGQRIARERLSKMTTHAPAPSVKVDVKTGESLGKEIGPMVAESKSSALGALDAINTAARIKTALSSGNVTLGPTATVRNQIDQVAQVMGVAGKNTEEKLVNTREVTRGLAQFTIAARKALKGQGQVSDFEGKLLTRAESGAIDDFTMPELKAFIATTDRLARRQYGLHKSNVDVMRKRPDLEKLVPFYEVPDLPVSGNPQDAAALEWANANPADPRAAKIKQRLGAN